MLNEIFGWWWIAVGFALGALLGTGFDRDGWLGGYSGLRRRLLRLGHIACVALGMLNVLFAQSAPRLGLDEPLLAVASWLLLTGAVLMPVSCVLVAWWRGLKPLFAVPVLALLGGTVLVALGNSEVLYP